MPKVESAGGIVLNPRGEVLIVTNEIGTKTIPKGSVENGEEPDETARREIFEESGLDEIELVRELGVIVRPGHSREKPNIPSVEKHIHVFLARTTKTEVAPQSKDVSAAEWFLLDAIPTQLTYPEEVEFFAQHIEEIE